MVVGQVITGKIKTIFKTNLLVIFENNYEGFLHISEVSDYFVLNLNLMFKVGQEYEFEIFEIDNINKKLKLIWKSIHPRFLRNPFSFIIKETKGGFKNLFDQTMKEVEND